MKQLGVKFKEEPEIGRMLGKAFIKTAKKMRLVWIEHTTSRFH